MFMRSLLRLIPPLLYMAGIYALSSIPDLDTPETAAEKLLQWAPPELQNLLHIPLFGGLAVVWHWSLRPSIGNRRLRLTLVFIITTLYAVLDEWHQLHVPGRFGSLTDVALNLVGIMGAVAFFAIRHRPLAPSLEADEEA